MSLLADNTRRWASHRTKPAFAAAGHKFAQRAFVHKEEYQRVADEVHAQTSHRFPWWFIPLVHERECTRGVDNWNCNIAQGSPYNVKSNIIPHSGPFASWFQAAVDALIVQAPHAGKWTNWSGGGALTIAEAYNGLGYAKRGLPSPYIWSGTDQYIKGKYVADGKFDPNFVDTQLGVAVALQALMDLDPTITLDGNLPDQDKTPRKAETATTATGMSSTVATVKLFGSYYILSWWDVTGIVFGAVAVVGTIVYFINRHKRTQLQ